MKKLIALLLIITFIGMNCATYEKGRGINLSPGQKPGTKLIIQKTNGQQIKGELIAVKQSSLLLIEEESGADKSISITDIKVVKIVRKSRFLLAAGTGLLIGAGIGALIGSSMHKSNTFDVWGSELGALAGAGAGAIIGMIIESFISSDKTIQFEGKSEVETKEILEDLRKKARVPDFQ